MKKKTTKEYILDWYANILLVIMFFLMLRGCLKSCDEQHKTTSPVREVRIDSIKKDNDKIIIEVELLDSIKDVKTIEVKALDNDSTLKLFYELIRK